MTEYGATGAGAVITGIPVIYPQSVLIDSGGATEAFSCLTAAMAAFARGWSG